MPALYLLFWILVAVVIEKLTKHDRSKCPKCKPSRDDFGGRGGGEGGY